jgi:hypothetical protein
MKNLNKNLPYILAGIIFVVIVFCLIYIFSRPQKASAPSISFPTPVPTPTPTPPIPTNITPQETPLPEIPSDFKEAIFKLDNSQKLVSFLNRNFELINEESDHSLKPEEFFKAKKGNRADIATFASYVLFQNGHFSTIFRYKYLDKDQKEKFKTLTLAREKDKTLLIDLEDSKLKIYPGGSSVMDLLEFEEKRNNVKIIEYAAFNYGTTDFTKGAWLPR